MKIMCVLCKDNTTNVKFIKSLTESSIKPCLTTKLVGFVLFSSSLCEISFKNCEMLMTRVCKIHGKGKRTETHFLACVICIFLLCFVHRLCLDFLMNLHSVLNRLHFSSRVWQVAGIVMTHLFIGQINEQIESWKNPPRYKYRPSQDVNGRSGPFY